MFIERKVSSFSQNSHSEQRLECKCGLFMCVKVCKSGFHVVDVQKGFH